MFPTFSGESRKRNINLGGAKSTATLPDVLRAAMTSRSEREDVRRRQESASKLQAWWRSTVQGRMIRDQMRSAFDQQAPVELVTWTRYLVLIYRAGPEDQRRLARWSTRILSLDQGLFQPFNSPEKNSWLVLVRQVLLLLLRSVAQAPDSPDSSLHLRVLTSALSVTSCQKAIPGHGQLLCADITSYLVVRGFYTYLAQSFLQIPVESKASQSIPPLTALSTAPFSIFPSGSPHFPTSIDQFMSCILSLPLLPNRLPLETLVQFSAAIPYQLFPLVHISSVSNSLSSDAAIHLLANLTTFTNPRYPKLPLAVIETLLSIFSALLDAIPIGSLEPSRTTKAVEVWVAPEDSDSDDGNITAENVIGTSMETLPKIDSRTATRLLALVSSPHLTTLYTITSSNPAARMHFIHFLLSLIISWPTKREGILTSVIAVSSGVLLKDLWRSFVRRSPLGKDDDYKLIVDPSLASEWPPLLFFTVLYTQTLLTMGDDEFFSSAPSLSTPRNPLSLDELTAFSRQLLNIAFPLYWHEDQSDVKERTVPGVRMRWEGVRDQVTKCLQAIHARDSRRPFTPPGHWLVTSQIDMLSFVEAAVVEEQEVTENQEIAPVSRPISKRQMAYLSPRLGVLNNIPFSIPFEVRVAIFRHFVENDMRKLGIERFSHHRSRRRVAVRRQNIAQDAFDHLNDLGRALKLPLEIAFIDQFGQEEAGIDGGGVFRELLTSLSKEVFDTNRGLWLETKRHELYPNPHSYAQEAHQLNWYRFIGRVLGKALYENILIDVGFASFFLAKWLGKSSYLDDLASLDPELYQGLIFLKHYPGSPEELSLNFTISENDMGVVKTVDLRPNGSAIPVTRENRLQYIYLVSHYKLTKQIKKQSDAFFEGLSDIIDPKWLRMFNQQELKIVVGGVEGPIDLDDLRQNVVYGGLYDDNHPTIKAFWKVVETFDQDQRRALLRFVTSCSRPPLLGFKELFPKFSIRDAGDDGNRLPTASTCVCLLKLPRYQTEGVLRQKLLQAINSGAGFDLS